MSSNDIRASGAARPDSSEAALPGSTDRFERLMEVVALASVGEYGPALDHFRNVEEDTFGLLEEGLRVFIRELQQGHAAREEASAALDRARKEIESKLALIETQRLEIRAL